MVEQLTPCRVLAIAAHPDDIDFGAAGTIAAWTQVGAEVSYLILTDGAVGALDPDSAPPDLAQVRRQEQIDAAHEVGVEEVFFLDYPDGSLTVTPKLRKEISAVIRRVKPDVVLAQSPERLWERIRASHPDHLAAGEAVVSAVYPDARNPLAYPELARAGLEAHVVKELWLMASPRPNRAVDVTGTFERKIAALLCHRSQVGDGEGLAERLKEMLKLQAQHFGLPEGALAEVFQVVDTR